MRDETKSAESAPEKLIEIFTRLFAETSRWPVAVLIVLGATHAYGPRAVLSAIDCMVHRGLVYLCDHGAYAVCAGVKLSSPCAERVTQLEAELEETRRRCRDALARAEQAEKKIADLRKALEVTLGVGVLLSV